MPGDEEILDPVGLTVGELQDLARGWSSNEGALTALMLIMQTRSAIGNRLGIKILDTTAALSDCKFLIANDFVLNWSFIWNFLEGAGDLLATEIIDDISSIDSIVLQKIINCYSC